MNGPVTWETLRTLSEEAGIGEEFQDFQDSLKNLLTAALINATGTSERFMKDPTFQTQVGFLVTVMVNALVQHEHRSTLTNQQLADLTKIFEQEAKSWGQ